MRAPVLAGAIGDLAVDRTGSADYEGKPAPMPALGAAAAEPLRFLDFPIHDPIRAVLLHGSGVPVLVPSPERYAIHKLIVGSRRRREGDGATKADKDRGQAATLLRTMILLRREQDLADAWMEAWVRGPAWREAMETSLRTFDEDTLAQVKIGLARGVTSLGGAPAGHGL